MNTEYGFKWGPIEVIRVASHPTWGYAIEVVTGKQRQIVRVTPAGLIKPQKIVKNLETITYEKRTQDTQHAKA